MSGAARFFVDENLLPVGRALSAVRRDVVYPSHPDLPEVPCGTKDPDWIPLMGPTRHDLIVITRDKRIKRKSHEAALCRDHRVRLFVVTSKKPLTMWEQLRQLVRHWERLERGVAKAGKGPWSLSITQGGVGDLVLW